jgi:undecaprenyl-diphosphatase
MKSLSDWPGRLLTSGWTSLRAVLAWIGQHDLGVLLTVLIVLLSLWGFAELADEVGEGATQRFDEWSVRAMRRPDNPARPIGPRWLEEAVRDTTALGSVIVLTLFVAAVAGFLWLTRAYRSLSLVLASTLSGVAVSFFLKGLFDRPRPSIVPHLSHVSTASFPSGHSMMSAVVFLTLGAVLAESVESRVLKAYFLLVAAVLTGLVGFSRVFLGVHYPTDVLGGWIAGLAWALGCGLIARLFKRRGGATQIQAPLPDARNSTRPLDR